MARYCLAPAAQEDLRDHWHYIGVDNQNATAADGLLDKFFENFQLLAQFPEIGAVAHEFQEIRSGMRFFPVGNYVVFYRPTNQQSMIEILRVIRTEQDALSLFSRD